MGRESRRHCLEDEYGFRDTVKKDFKVYPIIVRANGLEKMVLAVENNGFHRKEIQFSRKLLEELGMLDYEIMHSVTISSLDDQQEIRVHQKFDRKTFTCPPSSRSYYHNEAERWWPHLFGQGQLSQVESTVHVQLTYNMARALDCSALTTSEFYKLPRCRKCVDFSPGNHKVKGDDSIFNTRPDDRTGLVVNPKNDYYWLMDKQTYNTIKFCSERKPGIIIDYRRRMEKRDKFITSKKYLEIAKGDPVWWHSCFPCCFPG